MMKMREIMKIPASLKSEMAYSRRLLEAGLNAASAAPDGAPHQTLAPELARAARSAWVPAMIGAAVGVLAVYSARKSRPGRGALLAGLIGGAFGFSGGVAWSSRAATSVAVRHAAKSIGAVRDERWLQKHPIAYA